MPYVAFPNFNHYRKTSPPFIKEQVFPGIHCWTSCHRMVVNPQPSLCCMECRGWFSRGTLWILPAAPWILQPRLPTSWETVPSVESCAHQIWFTVTDPWTSASHLKTHKRKRWQSFLTHSPGAEEMWGNQPFTRPALSEVSTFKGCQAVFYVWSFKQAFSLQNVLAAQLDQPFWDPA